MNDSLQNEAAQLLGKEKAAWENSVAFITERVAFNIRPLIRTLRKLYWGVFDVPTDPMTGRQKIFIPMVESFVESSVKNIDLDTKDVNVRAKHPKAIGLSSVFRSCLKNTLDEIGFGEKLDLFERNLAIDGTAVWHISETKDSDGNPIPAIRQVDLLNFYIDPTSESIQSTEAVIERVVMEESDFKKMAKSEGWANTDKVKPVTNVSRTDGEFNITMGNTASSVKFVEVYVRTGKLSKVYITGKEEDRDTTIDAELVCSQAGSTWVFHAAKKLKDSTKPYEEAWYTRVPGRWYGRGVAEKLMMLQVWLNTIVNIRINRAYVAQLGIFKIRRGSGITPQMISRLASNGAILVNGQDDIEQLTMQEASQASYNDESVIKDWGQRVTAAFEVVTGESLPASTSATAVGVQATNAQSQFSLIKEGVGMFLERVIDDHIIDIVEKKMTPGYIVRTTGNMEELRAFDEAIANHLLYQKLDEVLATGALVDPQQVELERQRLIGQIQSLGKDRFIKLIEEADFDDYDIKVYITNEEFDKGAMIQNLVSVLQVAGSNPALGINAQDIVRQMMDLMGLESSPATQQPQIPGAPQASPAPNQQQINPMQQMMAAYTQGNMTKPNGTQ